MALADEYDAKTYACAMSLVQSLILAKGGVHPKALLAMSVADLIKLIGPNDIQFKYVGPVLTVKENQNGT